jgi:hypothetical protein
MPFRRPFFILSLFVASALACSELRPPLPAPSADRAFLMPGETIQLSVAADDDESSDLFWSASPAAGTFEPVQGPHVTFRAASTHVARDVKIRVVSRKRLMAGPSLSVQILPSGTNLAGDPAGGPSRHPQGLTGENGNGP